MLKHCILFLSILLGSSYLMAQSPKIKVENITETSAYITVEVDQESDFVVADIAYLIKFDTSNKELLELSIIAQLLETKTELESTTSFEQNFLLPGTSYLVCAQGYSTSTEEGGTPVYEIFTTKGELPAMSFTIPNQEKAAFKYTVKRNSSVYGYKIGSVNKADYDEGKFSQQAVRDYLDKKEAIYNKDELSVELPKEYDTEFYILIQARDFNGKDSTFMYAVKTPKENVESENNFANQSNISLYPIPVKSISTISSAERMQKIEIYSMVGEKLFSRNINDYTYDLNLSSLSAANYIIRIYTESGKVVCKRFVVAQ